MAPSGNDPVYGNVVGAAWSHRRDPHPGPAVGVLTTAAGTYEIWWVWMGVNTILERVASRAGFSLFGWGSGQGKGIALVKPASSPPRRLVMRSPLGM